jgi:hypothetical protein
MELIDMKIMVYSKTMIPIGHGDSSSFKFFRTPINVEDAIIKSTSSCKYTGYAPSYGLLETCSKNTQKECCLWKPP